MKLSYTKNSSKTATFKISSLSDSAIISKLIVVECQFEFLQQELDWSNFQLIQHNKALYLYLQDFLEQPHYLS